MTGRLARWFASPRRTVGTAAGALLLAGGITSIGVAAASQYHAPQPGAAQAGSVSPTASVRSGAGRGGGVPAPPAGSTASGAAGSAAGAADRSAGSAGPSAGPAAGSAGSAGSAGGQAASVQGPTLPRSVPVSITIPSIGVHSSVFQVGLNADGTIQVPPLSHSPLTNEAAWYRYSPTPGQVGPSIIEGHIDSAAQGPSVFYRLGAVRPGDTVDVDLKDGTVAVFRVSGVREYAKSHFPTATVYGNTDYAGLRLLTCGGTFDYTTHHYLSNTVVYASLVGSHPGSPAPAGE